MKKRFYEEPEVEVITYGHTNIITASLGENGNDDTEDGWSDTF